jgi:hypothetical protein
MNLLRPDFGELYQRHLCRHSQFGINVQHLVGVTITYLCLCGLMRDVTGLPWLLAVCSLLYLVAIVLNAPLRIALVTVMFVTLLSLVVMTIPPLYWWIYVIVIVLAYKIQAWTHRYWDVAFDMTEFDKKYQKGLSLFVLLSIYELPILLTYLLFWGARARTNVQGGCATIANGRKLTHVGMVPGQLS